MPPKGVLSLLFSIDQASTICSGRDVEIKGLGTLTLVPLKS